MERTQIEDLLAALDAYPDQSAADAVRLLILTGAREGEVLSATWDQFDLKRGIAKALAGTARLLHQFVVYLCQPGELVTASASSLQVEPAMQPMPL